MAVVAVDSAAAVAVAAATGTKHQVVVNNAGGSTAYLDVSSAVTDANGWPLGAGDDISLNIGEGETLYARCAAGLSTSLRVLSTGGA